MVMVEMKVANALRDKDVGQRTDLPSALTRRMLVLDSREVILYESIDWSNYFVSLLISVLKSLSAE